MFRARGVWCYQRGVRVATEYVGLRHFGTLTMRGTNEFVLVRVEIGHATYGKYGVNVVWVM